jgi:hypothetical protein
VPICSVFVVKSADLGQACGIAPRLRTRSQRSPNGLPGRVAASLLTAAVVLFSGWHVPLARADAARATSTIADLATEAADHTAPGLPTAVTPTDEVSTSGEAPSETQPAPSSRQEPAEPTTTPEAPPAPAQGTPAPDAEPPRPLPAPDAGPQPAPDAEPPPTSDAEPPRPLPVPEAEPEPPQAQPAPEVTTKHPAGAVDVTTAGSPSVEQSIAPAGSHPQPAGPPISSPPVPPTSSPPTTLTQVDEPDPGPAPARPRRSRTSTAWAPNLLALHGPAALRRLAHESPPGPAYASAPLRSVRKQSARPHQSVTRAGSSKSDPAPEAPHRRGDPGAASAAGNGTASSSSNAVLSGGAALAPSGPVGRLRLARPAAGRMSVAEPREWPD